MQIPKKVVLFRWSLINCGIHVKSWMRGHFHDFKCDSHGFPIESVHNVLWVCPVARVVLKRMLRILYIIHGKQVYTWGFVRRGRLAKEIQNYENEYVDYLKTCIEGLLSFNNPLFGRGQGLVYDLFFSSLGIVESNM